MRRAYDYAIRTVITIKVPGKRGRERRRWKWMDIFKNDLCEKGLSGEDVKTGLCGEDSEEISSTR